MAGLKAGDTITSFNGVRITSYDQLQNEIRKHPDEKVTLGVDRKGQQLTVPVALTHNTLYGIDSNGNPTDQLVKAGFLGIQPITPTTQLSLGQSVDKMTGIAQQGVSSIVSLPSKIPGLWGAAFEGKKRSLDSPVGVVGVARVGGDVLAMHAPASARIATMLQLLAGLNLSLFLLNMLPLLPLDGGHIAGALWEAVRRQFARLVKRPDPGPFDVAKLMPVAYVVAGIFLCFTVLVMIADVVNPVRLG
jgi:membrane-associated protease RseP (regulator of RpoE activity)